MDSSVINIYKSSAGSGKTYTLVREYLGLALVHPERYKHILAITFTNKAAAEMKERIVSALMELSNGKNPDLADQIVEIYKLDLPTIKERAATVLSHILHDYVNFGVSTIDSFTSKIVRNFSHDLDLPSRFDIEMDSRGLIERMTDQLIAQIGENEYITEVLIHFAQEKFQGNGTWNLDDDLQTVGKQLFIHESQPYLDALQAIAKENILEFIDTIAQQQKEYPEKVKAIIRKMVQLAADAGLKDEDFKAGRSSTLEMLSRALKAKNPSQFKKVLAGTTVFKALNEGKWATKMGPGLQRLLEGEFRALADELVEYHEREFPMYVTAYYAFQQIHSLVVLREVEQLLEVHKKENNLVHISDFQKKIADFIKHESPEYIYWRLGNRYQYFLLDEFQDTSVIQWANLSPLFENMLAEADPDGSILLVGDSKQAIYRFRGGKVELLEYDAPLQLESVPILLETNWRSKEQIVNFNNSFFSAARNLFPGNEIVQNIYADFHQHTAKKNLGGGYVKIKGLPNSNFTDESNQETLNAIYEAQQDNFQLSDIAILVRSSKHGSDVAKFLTENGVPVISSDSLLLYKEPAVSFLVSLLQLLSKRFDKTIKAEILHYVMVYQNPNLTNTELVFDITDESQPHLFAATKAFREVLLSDSWDDFNAKMPEEFRSLRFRLNRMPLYEVTEELIRIFSLDKVARVYVQQFLDVILDFTDKFRSDLDGFLAHWAEKKDTYSIVVPEGVDAVEIITIHKAKGLEYPVVILPNTTTSLSPNSSSLFWAESAVALGEFPSNFLIPANENIEETAFADSYRREKDYTLLDNLNILYVAFTRPRERLYIFYQIKSAHAKFKKGSIPREELKTMSDLIAGVIVEAFEDNATGVNDGLEMGFPEPFIRSEEKSPSETIDNIITYPWQKRIRIDLKNKKVWTTGGKNELNAGAIPLESLTRQVLHKMRRKNEMNRIFKDLVEAGLMLSAHTISLKTKLDRMLSQEPLSSWYADDAQVKTEAAILTQEGELYVPGRLVLHEEKALLIDFRFEEDVADIQANQQAYADSLKQMNFTQIETFIVDIETEEVI